MKYTEAKQLARQMRLNPTDAERALWQHIRSRQLEDKKFLRQHPIFIRVLNGESFYFIPDFFCYEKKLAIELDGSIHKYMAEKDAKRDEILSNNGITVLRINNSELDDIKSVLQKIQEHLT